MKWLVPFLLCCYLFPAVAQPPSPATLKLAKPAFLACTPVKDQAMSSTCWSFSSNSLLESELLRNGKLTEDLSEMFVARYSMVRKIRRHLQLKGGNFFTPGGQFHDVVWVMKNFGMMPEQAYTGRVNNAGTHDHSMLDTLLSRFVNDCVATGITELNDRQEHYVDSLLDEYLGPVPDFFEYKGSTYTPRSFLQRYLEIDPDDYVEVTSYTHHPFYTRFVLEDKYNWSGDAYWNVPLRDFMRITDAALAAGFTVGWDGDADDPDFDYYAGMARLGKPYTGDWQQKRQEDFTSEATLLNHMMHVVGSARDLNGNTWYCIKNSWGRFSNPLGGYLWMKEDYFKLRTVAIIVNRAALPVDIRNKQGF